MYTIVGQGLAGSLLAFQLLERGQQVQIFNAPSLPSSSQVAAGMFNPVTGKRLAKTWLIDDLFPYLHQFYTHLETVLNTRFFYPQALYRPFKTIEEQNYFTAKTASPQLSGLLSTEANHLAYSDIIHNPLGGLLTHQAGWVDVPLLLAGLREYFLEREVLKEEVFDYRQPHPCPSPMERGASTPVDEETVADLPSADGRRKASTPVDEKTVMGLQFADGERSASTPVAGADLPSADGWRKTSTPVDEETVADLQSADGRREMFIFCEGVGVVQNPYFSWLPLQLVKGETLTLDIPNAWLEQIVNQGVFIVPLGGNQYKVGSTYNWQDLAWESTEVGKQELTEKLDVLLKKPYQIIKQQAGVRPATPDRRPFLGLHPDYPNIGIFNGLGTKGVSLAPYFSNHFAEFLVNQKELCPDVNILRFQSLYLSRKR